MSWLCSWNNKKPLTYNIDKIVYILCKKVLHRWCQIFRLCAQRVPCTSSTWIPLYGDICWIVSILNDHQNRNKKSLILHSTLSLPILCNLHYKICSISVPTKKIRKIRCYSERVEYFYITSVIWRINLSGTKYLTTFCGWKKNGVILSEPKFTFILCYEFQAYCQFTSFFCFSNFRFAAIGRPNNKCTIRSH